MVHIARKKKSDKNKYIIGAIVAIAVVVIVLYSGIFSTGLTSLNGTGDTPDLPGSDVPTATSTDIDLGLSDFEIFSLIEVLAGKSLSYTEVGPYITALNMKVYARDDLDAQTLLQWFEAEYAQDGWTSLGSTRQVGLHWVVYHEAWIQVANARSISIGEGAAINLALGHDTVYLVAYGPATTYYQFYNLIK